MIINFFEPARSAAVNQNKLLSPYPPPPPPPPKKKKKKKNLKKNSC